MGLPRSKELKELYGCAVHFLIRPECKHRRIFVGRKTKLPKMKIRKHSDLSWLTLSSQRRAEKERSAWSSVFNPDHGKGKAAALIFEPGASQPGFGIVPWTGKTEPLKPTIYPLDPAAFPAMLQDRRSVHPAERWQAFHWSEAHQVRLDGSYLYSQSTRFTCRQFLSESNFHFHHQSGPAGNSSSAGRARKWLAESLLRQNQSDKPGKGRHLTTSQKRTNGPTMICGTVCSFFWCSYLVFIFYISFLRLFFRVCFWMSIFDELPTTNPVSWSGLVKDHGLMIAIVLLVFFA